MIYNAKVHCTVVPTGLGHEALRTLVLVREQGEIRDLRGQLKWEGDLDEQRQSRFAPK